jgi:hypothetical protein
MRRVQYCRTPGSARGAPGDRSPYRHRKACDANVANRRVCLARHFVWEMRLAGLPTRETRRLVRQNESTGLPLYCIAP